MTKTIACMFGALLIACGNSEAKPETPSAAGSAASSAPAMSASAPAPTPSASASASASTAAPAASGSAAPVADEGVVIQTRGNVITVNGTVAGALGDRLDDLSTKLKNTKDLWMKVHPGQPFPGRATVKTEKTTPAAGVAHIVDVAKAAGYPNVSVTP